MDKPQISKKFLIDRNKRITNAESKFEDKTNVLESKPKTTPYSASFLLNKDKNGVDLTKKTELCMEREKILNTRAFALKSLDEINYNRLRSEVNQKNVIAKLRLAEYQLNKKKNLSAEDYRKIMKNLLEEVSKNVFDSQKLNSDVEESVTRLKSEMQGLGA